MSKQAKILYLINYVGVLACILVSAPLWGLETRTIPEIAFFSNLEIPLGKWNMLFTCLGICAMGLALIKREKTFFLIGLGAFIVLILSDVIRLQPWIYIHFFIMGYLVFSDDISAKRAIILILGLTYVWSGIQKFNVFFATELYPWFWQAFDKNALQLGNDVRIEAQSTGVYPSQLWGAYVPPVIESISGILLLTFSKRWWAYILPIGIHFVILSIVGPWGHKFNFVIWPWNIMLIVLLIFLAKNAVGWERKTWIQAKFYPIYILVGLAPFLFPFALWDSHLSGSLYSGQNSYAIFYFDATTGCTCITGSESAMDKDVSYVTEHNQMGLTYLDNWVIEDVEAPFYPEERYFKAFAKKLCDCQQDNSASYLEIYSTKRWGVERYLENEVTAISKETQRLPYLRKQVFYCKDLSPY